MSAATASGEKQSGVLGIFSYVDVTVEALRRLRAAGWTAFRVYSPAPRHELMAELEPTGWSAVRVFSLVGALTGTASGFALTFFTEWRLHTFDWLIVYGKPVIALPPDFVIAFELTILFGSLATMLGFLIFSRRPRWKPMPGYEAEFSNDQFGIFVPCNPSQFEEVKRVFAEAGAEGVRVEEA